MISSRNGRNVPPGVSIIDFQKRNLVGNASGDGGWLGNFHSVQLFGQLSLLVQLSLLELFLHFSIIFLIFL